METVNALKVRNNFGEILDMLDSGRDPILIEKRKKIRAVLISYEDFRTRFLDKLLVEERDRFIRRVHSHVSESAAEGDPTTYLRALRGYVD